MRWLGLAAILLGCVPTAASTRAVPEPEMVFPAPYLIDYQAVVGRVAIRLDLLRYQHGPLPVQRTQAVQLAKSVCGGEVFLFSEWLEPTDTSYAMIFGCEVH